MSSTSDIDHRSETGRLRASLLKNHPFFNELPPADIAHLSSYMKRRSAKKDEVIFRKGDPGLGLIGVIFGSIKISAPSREGKDIVLNIIREGEVFGEIALLDGHPRTADATAMADCEFVVIERREFLPFLRSRPDAALKLLNILCARLRRTSEQVQDVTFLGLPVRLAKALLQLSSSIGSPRQAGRLTITQREIGQIVGKSREATNKQLREWSKKGWVKLERRGITVLKRPKLAEIAAMNTDLDLS
jgi:CRP/FNR family cyclic AMP-dependent transcriptional regulator